MQIVDTVIHYRKVADLYEDLGMPIRQDSEFSINNLLEIHKFLPYKSPLFRADYYSFIFIKKGRGNYTIDERNFEYSSGAIYFTNPGHLKAFEFYELSEAYLVTLSENFLKTYVHRDVFEEFPFLLTEIIPPLVMPSEDFRRIESLYLQILAESRSKEKSKNKIIGYLFVVLLLKLKESFWSDYDPLEDGRKSSKIVKQFKEDLERYFSNLRSEKEARLVQAKEFAALQGLHPSYLSNVIKSKTGKPISEWITEKSLSHAKSLLKNSNVSIKEVSYLLGYSEVANFSKFFKKKVGISPKMYRRNGKLQD